MNEFCAAMGLCNLRHINDNIASRKAAVDRYRYHLEGVNGIKLSYVNPDVEYNYAYFPVVFDKKIFGSSRTEVQERLKENSISARKYFYPLTNSFSAFNGKYDVMKTPIALHVSKNILALPLYADMSIGDVDRICELILSIRKV